MRVAELMTSPVRTLPDTATLEDVARLMLEHLVGGVPIVDAEGKLVGIVTESDFAAKEAHVPFSLFRAPKLFGRWLDKNGIEALYQEARTVRVTEVMTRHVVTVREDEPVERVVHLMMERDVNRVPVVREGKPVGIVARLDLLRMMMAK